MIPIEIWVTTDGVLHANINITKDKIYDSSKDPVYLENLQTFV
jgi:hypothetical protein